MLEAKSQPSAKGRSIYSAPKDHASTFFKKSLHRLASHREMNFPNARLSPIVFALRAEPEAGWTLVRRSHRLLCQI